MADRWHHVNSLFLDALDREPGERATFLAQACAGDEELRRDVESLLASHEQAGHFLEQPLIRADALAERRSSEDTDLADETLLGRLVAGYRIDARLGSGGMGVVYKAYDLKLDRPVALKLLPRRIAVDAERLRRSRLEARAASSLNHPNIVVVHDFGEEGGLPFMVTEYVEGQTLRDRLDHGALPIVELVHVAVQIASALAAAHERGVLHRDIKPENVMLRPDGYVKVLDFGLAKLVTANESVTPEHTETAVGIIIGTPRYMSPEQARGERVTFQSDQFSFGILLYELATGRSPFRRASAIETAAAVITAPAESLGRAAPHMPPALRDIIERCLAKDAGGRYPSTRDLCTDLLTVQRTSSHEHAMSSWRLAVSRPRSLVWTTLTAALVGGGLLLATRSISPYGSSSTLPFGNPTSIAVLPLLNAGGSDETEYLSDGISDALIDRLSRLPQLRVMARGTVFSYKGREVDPRTIGQDLDVRVVFTGRLTQRDDRTIIQANLADAENGVQIWGDHYTGRIADLPNLQETLTRNVLSTLQLELTAEQQERITHRDTRNAAAYRLFLEGRYYSNRLTMDGLKRAIELMNQAVALDPTYAVAYAGLADVYADASGIYLSAGEAMPRARAAAEQALRLDGNLAGAHALLGYMKGTQDWRWTDAEEELERAIALHPGYARAHEAYGHILMIQGRTSDAIAAMMRARDVDPRNDLINATLGWFYYLARRDQEALAWLQQLLEVDSKLVAAHYNRGMVYEQMGRQREALAAFQEAQNLDPTNLPVSALLCHAYAASGQSQRAQHLLAQLTQHATHRRLDPAWIGLIHGALGDQQQAFDWLEKAFHARSELLLFLKVDPKFDSLRAHPRFEDLLRRLNLLPESARDGI